MHISGPKKNVAALYSDPELNVTGIVRVAIPHFYQTCIPPNLNDHIYGECQFRVEKHLQKHTKSVSVYTNIYSSSPFWQLDDANLQKKG